MFALFRVWHHFWREAGNIKADGKSTMSLTARQERFVAEYLIDLNGTKAAIRAGYSENGANRRASDLLSNVDIQAAVAKAQARRSKRTEITQDRVLRELAKIGFADIRKAVNWGRSPIDTQSENANPNELRVFPVELVPSEEIDNDTASAVSEVSLTQGGVRVKMYDKRAALEALLRHTTDQHGGGQDQVAEALNKIADKLPG